MYRVLSLIFGGFLLVAQVQAASDTPDAMPVFLVSTFAPSELMARLKTEPDFKGLNDKRVGAPLTLTVTHSILPSRGAGSVAAETGAGILAGVSLGLLPMVSKRDLVVTYDLTVHGMLLASYSYRQNFTKATSMYSGPDAILKLNDKQQAWALDTTTDFLSSVTGDPEFRRLAVSYQRYFSKTQ